MPSNAEIIRPCNTDVCLLLLRAVLGQGAHRLGGATYGKVAALLWENSPVVTGPFFGRFQEWAPTQIQRNMKERASSIIGHYSLFEPDAVPHLTQLQRLASQLHNVITAIAEMKGSVQPPQLPMAEVCHVVARSIRQIIDTEMRMHGELFHHLLLVLRDV